MTTGKRKADEEELAAGEDYRIDWHAQPRRAFKRGFIPYEARDSAEEAAAASRRKALGLSVADPAGEEATPPPVESFEGLGALPPWLLEALRDQGRYEPTPLQSQALPVLLAGQNMVGIAPQGAGQALAYLLPCAVHCADQPDLTEEEPGPIALILVPTQEQATQVAAAATELLRLSGSHLGPRGTLGVRAVNVSGGGARSEKLKELTSRGSDIVIGTPKRVHDMASKEQMTLLRVTYLVLDGADKIEELGFSREVEELASWIRPERQTTMLTASWPKALGEMANKLCFAGGLPVRIRVGAPPAALGAARARAAVAGKGKAAGGPGAAAPPWAATAPAPAEKPAEDVAVPAPAAADDGGEDFPDDW